MMKVVDSSVYKYKFCKKKKVFFMGVFVIR